ncbi:hypothetical protein B0H11DRAFT_2235011 [Mycena galericulata]|nr:hypothetical protein B0H11DRAFT_2235011 [Mycena galericulata]
MTTPPPPYSRDSETDLAEILLRLDTLNLGSRSPRLEPAPRISTPPQCLRTTYNLSPPPDIARGDAPRLYLCESPIRRGQMYTTFWDEAADATQGVPGATARRLFRQKPSRKKKGGYAIFVGSQIGAFRHWDEARRCVEGVSGCLYQGYGSFEAAVAAFEYAQARLWTRKCDGAASILSSAPAPVVPELPTPVGLLDAPNPLHSDQSMPGKGIWYIVYSGITPGVYQSSLECSLNTVGLPNAVYDLCNSKDEAVERFQRALAAGRVKVVTPQYS